MQYRGKINTPSAQSNTAVTTIAGLTASVFEISDISRAEQLSDFRAIPCSWNGLVTLRWGPPMVL